MITNSDPEWIKLIADLAFDGEATVEQLQADPDTDLRAIVFTEMATCQFVANVCARLEDSRGEVHAKIESIKGRTVITLHRVPIDESVPLFLRKQSDG